MARRLIELSLWAAVMFFVGVALNVDNSRAEWEKIRFQFAAPGHSEHLQEALDQWNQCGIVELREGSSLLESGVLVLWSDFGHTPDWAGRTYGLPNRYGNLVRVRVNVNQWWLDRDFAGKEVALLAHEVGHALGIMHSGDGLMGVYGTLHHDGVQPEDCEKLNEIFRHSY